MNGAHYKKVCSCGKLISQCRCMGPKVEQKVENGCEDCRKKIARAQEFNTLLAQGLK